MFAGRARGERGAPGPRVWWAAGTMGRREWVGAADQVGCFFLLGGVGSGGAAAGVELGRLAS